MSAGKSQRRPSRRGRTRSSRGASTSGGVWGRLARGLLTGLLLLVVVLFGATKLGLIEFRALWPDPTPRITPAVTWELSPDELHSSLRRNEAETEDPKPQGEASDGGAAPVAADPVPDPVRVYVTNGCGVNLLAAGYRPLFQDAGFDVCGVSNADRSDYQETLVVDRSGRPGAAASVCAYLQEVYDIGRILLQTRAVSPEGDVLVILGRDAACALDSADQGDPSTGI